MSLQPLCHPSAAITIQIKKSLNYKVTCSDKIRKKQCDEVAKNISSTIVKIRDFFHKYFGLNGLDGKGHMAPVVIRGNTDNAHWTCDINNQCHFEFDNIYAQTPEVVAHEYMHGVVHLLNPKLERDNQPGALHESLADVMAIVFKRSVIRQCDWKIADIRDISTKSHKSQYSPLNGVHENSKIPSFAFFLAYQNTRDLKKLAQVWFKSISTLTRCATFNQLAKRTIEIAKPETQFGKGIIKAWKDVGVL